MSVGNIVDAFKNGCNWAFDSVWLLHCPLLFAYSVYSYSRYVEFYYLHTGYVHTLVFPAEFGTWIF